MNHDANGAYLICPECRTRAAWVDPYASDAPLSDPDDDRTRIFVSQPGRADDGQFALITWWRRRRFGAAAGRCGLKPAGPCIVSRGRDRQRRLHSSSLPLLSSAIAQWRGRGLVIARHTRCT